MVNTLNLSDTTNMCLANGNAVNPFFAHRSRSSDGTIIKNWESDKEVPIDGYYLAQRSGDASRRPYMLRPGQSLNYDNGVCSDCYMEECELTVSDMGRWRGGHWEWHPNTYQSSEGGPLTLTFTFLSNCQWPDVGPSLTLNFTDGTSLRVSLPPLGALPDSTYLALYVGEDGSTWWGHTSRAPIEWAPNFMNMDVWYAMRWSEGNLASSIYDCRYFHAMNEGWQEGWGLVPASPAVDAGSKDWLNGGFTNTDYFSADNPAPLNFGDPDNLDGNGNPTAWDDSDKHLDIGYHYGAADQTKDSSTTYTTLRHPKERIPSFDGISPNVSSSDDMILVSGKYDETTGKDTTIAIYKGTTTNNQIPICYKLFRGSDTEIGMIYDIPVAGEHQNHMITGTSGPANDSKQGAIYVAVNDWYFLKPATKSYYFNYWRINIYRYDTTVSPSPWQKIKQIVPQVLNEFSFQPEEMPYLSQPLGLTAKGNNLWVFWLFEEPDEYGNAVGIIKMGSTYIEGAANKGYSEPEDDLHYNGASLRTLDFSSIDRSLASLKVDWDDYLIYQNYPDGMPRIVFVNSFSDEFFTYPRIWAKRVFLEDGYPDSLDFYNSYQAMGYNNIKPTFCVNRPYDRFQISHNTNRAYCRFANPDETQIEKRNLNILQNGNDEWVMPTNHTISNAFQPSETYRAFGTERLFYLKNQQLYEEEMGIFDQAIGDVEYPQVITERPKAENIFLMHKGDSSDVVDIYHIVP